MHSSHMSLQVLVTCKSLHDNCVPDTLHILRESVEKFTKRHILLSGRTKIFRDVYKRQAQDMIFAT